MIKSGFINSAGLKLICYILVAVLHIIIIVYVAFRMDIVSNAAEQLAGVMKLVDVEEDIPLPPEEVSEIIPETQELFAENIIETDEIPPPAVIGGGAGPMNTGVRGGGAGAGPIEYLPQHRIEIVPDLKDIEDEIKRILVYPPIAQRSNIEGSVYLELFIDRQGSIRDVRIIREAPPDRGFGEAALNAFRRVRAKAKPAEANGEPVAVRYRYNISFTLR